MAALLTLVSNPEQRVLAAGLLRGFEELEQTNFEDLEPVGVAAPTGER